MPPILLNNICNIVKHLQNGKSLLYPTDTVWGLGCDATNAVAVQKIYTIKQRPDNKALIVLVPDIKMLEQYVADIPEQALQEINTCTQPLTIIYKKAKNLAHNLIAEDGSIAIRIPKHTFCQNLLQQFGKPIVSTSANISGKASPITFFEISMEIKNNVDGIVDIAFEESKNPMAKPSKIILFDENNNLITIRN